jgi:hypothetical protein
MKWRILALLGVGTFFYVSWDIFTNPNCNSVSFRGGGARTVLATCFSDGTGDFTRTSASLGSALLGLALLLILFWPLILSPFLKIKLQAPKFNSTQQTSNQNVLNSEDSISKPEESQEVVTHSRRIVYRVRRHKIISSVLIVFIGLVFYNFAAPSFSIFNPLTCASLKRDLAAQDTIGRQIWNSYQVEVSNLAQLNGTDGYYDQVGNVARRATQLLLSDSKGYSMLKAKPHCVNNIKALNQIILRTNNDYLYLTGLITKDDMKFSIYNGWNVDYYKSYGNFEFFLK